MKSKVLNRIGLTVAGVALLASSAFGAISTAQSKQGLTSLEKEVRHELVMLPWFGVFDNLEFQVNGGEVVLTGHVTRPTLKTAAERVVARVEGVGRVVNNIEVLPLSPHDDSIRRATYYAIYGDSMLSRYNWGAVPPIHIVVKNGNVTLQGVVANETDKNVATIRANGVSGVFSVTNELRVEDQS